MLLQGGWSQLENQRTHFGKSAPCQVLQTVKLAFHFLRLADVHRPRRFSGESNAEQCLCNRVVQVAGQAVAFVHRRQLAGLLVEPGVINGDSNLATDGTQQFEIALVPFADLLAGQVRHAQHLAFALERYAQVKLFERFQSAKPGW